MDMLCLGFILFCFFLSHEWYDELKFRGYDVYNLGCGVSTFPLYWMLPNCLENDLTIFFSHQQYMGVFISLPSCQYMVLSHLKILCYVFNFINVVF